MYRERTLDILLTIFLSKAMGEIYDFCVRENIEFDSKYILKVMRANAPVIVRQAQEAVDKEEAEELAKRVEDLTPAQRKIVMERLCPPEQKPPAPRTPSRKRRKAKAAVPDQQP